MSYLSSTGLAILAIALNVSSSERKRVVPLMAWSVPISANGFVCVREEKLTLTNFGLKIRPFLHRVSHLPKTLSMDKNEKRNRFFNFCHSVLHISWHSLSKCVVDAKRLKARTLIIIKLLIYFSLVGLSAELRFNNVNNHSALFGGSYVEFA